MIRLKAKAFVDVDYEKLVGSVFDRGRPAAASSIRFGSRIKWNLTFDEPPGSLNNPIESRLVGEASTDSAYLYALTLKGDIQSVHLTSSTSYFGWDQTTGPRVAVRRL